MNKAEAFIGLMVLVNFVFIIMEADLNAKGLAGQLQFRKPENPKIRPDVRPGVPPGLRPDVRLDVRPDCRRRRVCRQRRRKKNHLIEAAPFGRLDQI